MDDPGLDREVHRGALRGLGRINVFSGSVAALWGSIVEAARKADGHGLRVLDLASGGGDVALGIACRAKAAKLPIRVSGADISDLAIEFAANRASEQGLDVPFFRLDALNDPIPTDFDVITCTLFLHHLAEEDAARLLGKMAAVARRLVLVDDLIRSRAGYALAWAGCRLLSRSKIVHHDGPVSVASAFSMGEIRAMADEQRLEGSSIRRHWPERFLLSWSRP